VEEVHNDSRTPLEDAIALMTPLRKLYHCRDALRRHAFTSAAAKTEYTDALAKLKVVNETVKADLIAHNQTLQFVATVATAAAAVLDLAISVGALV
jgi:hypothetical protein